MLVEVVVVKVVPLEGAVWSIRPVVEVVVVAPKQHFRQRQEL